jgi:hypothetical protein
MCRAIVVFYPFLPPAEGRLAECRRPNLSKIRISPPEIRWTLNIPMVWAESRRPTLSKIRISPPEIRWTLNIPMVWAGSRLGTLSCQRQLPEIRFRTRKPWQTNGVAGWRNHCVIEAIAIHPFHVTWSPLKKNDTIVLSMVLARIAVQPSGQKHHPYITHCTDTFC